MMVDLAPKKVDTELSACEIEATLELGRTEIAESRVTTLTIIKDFNIVEDRFSRFHTRAEAREINQFDFQRSEYYGGQNMGLLPNSLWYFLGDLVLGEKSGASAARKPKIAALRLPEATQRPFLLPEKPKILSIGFERRAVDVNQLAAHQTSVVSPNYLVGFKRLPRRSGFQPDTISFYFSTIVGLEARPTRPKETVT